MLSIEIAFRTMAVLSVLGVSAVVWELGRLVVKWRRQRRARSEDLKAPSKSSVACPSLAAEVKRISARLAAKV